MKKKLMIVAVLLGAMSLGACVDDNESQSVTDVRNAKAEQLKGLAKLANAQAEAALVTANAEKAYKEAWAKYYEAQAALQDANTAAVLQQIEQNKVKFEAELETLKAEYESRLWEAKKSAAKAEQDMLDQADERLAILYNTYFNALQSLDGLKAEKVSTEFSLTQYKAGLASVNDWVVAQTAIKQASIDTKTAELNAWKNYGGLSKADLQAQDLELTQAKYTTFAAYQVKKDAKDALEDAYTAATEVFDRNYEKESPVAAVAALQKSELNGRMWRHYLGSDWSSAYQQVSASLAKGLCEYYSYDGNRNEYYVDAMDVYVDGSTYYVSDPIEKRSISLSEDLESVTVPMYSLRNTAVTTFITNYYATGKDNVINYLGSKASDNKLATGCYLRKEQAETTVADANKALTEAETAFPVKEKAYKTASDAKDAAKKTMDAAQKTSNEAVTAYSTASTAYNKVVADGGDAAAVAAAKKVMDDAQTALTAAQTAYDKALTKYNEADNACNTAWNEYNVASNVLANAKVFAKSAAVDLSAINDNIAATEENLANWDENSANWTAIVAALGNTAYKTAIEGLKTNTAVAAYITASIAENEAYDAYAEAYAKANVVNSLLNSSNVKNPAEEIRTLESDIASLNAEITALKDRYSNGLNSANNYEKIIADANATIESLNSQIEVQEAIVKQAKQRVEAAIAAQAPAE